MQHLCSDFVTLLLSWRFGSLYNLECAMIPNLISALSALSSSVYPDAGTLWSFPLHGSVFTTGNSGISWFSQAMSSLGELTCPDQGKTASLGEHKPVLEKPFPSLAASAILDISLDIGQNRVMLA